MKLFNSHDEQGNPHQIAIVDGEEDAPLEWLHEMPFNFSPEQTEAIKGIFEAHRKTEPAALNKPAFDLFIQKLESLIRFYHFYKSRTKEANQESESNAKISDWLKDLRQAQNTLEQILRSDFIVAQLDILEWHYQNVAAPSEDSQSAPRPRALVALVQDVSHVIKRLETLSGLMQNNIKPGRPKVDDIRHYFINEIARLYEKFSGIEPTKSENGPFDKLIYFLLEIVGDPIEDSLSAIKQAFKVKQG